MSGKILILLVTLVFLFASGCAEEDNTSSVPDEPDIPVPEAREDISSEENIPGLKTFVQGTFHVHFQ